MKTSLISLLLALTVLSGCHHGGTVPPPPPNPDWTINVSWDYNFANYLPCAGTPPRTQSCIQSFTWGYLIGAARTPLKTLPVATETSGQVHFTDSTNSQLPIGNVTFYCVADALDQNGNQITSDPANSLPVNVQVVAPDGFTVTIQ